MVKRYWWTAGLILALALVLLSPLASTQPDGLERVAEDQGFAAQARGPLFRLLPDYLVPGLGGAASTVAAGLIGGLVVGGLAFVLSRWLRGDS